MGRRGGEGLLEGVWEESRVLLTMCDTPAPVRVRAYAFWKLTSQSSSGNTPLVKEASVVGDARGSHGCL